MRKNSFKTLDWINEQQEANLTADDWEVIGAKELDVLSELLKAANVTDEKLDAIREKISHALAASYKQGYAECLEVLEAKANGR